MTLKFSDKEDFTFDHFFLFTERIPLSSNQNLHEKLHHNLELHHKLK